MGLKDILGVIIAGAAVMGLGYTVATRGGYIVDEARAQDIAQEKVEAEERARLEFMRDVKFSRLRLLNGIATPTPDDQLEAEILRDDIKRISDRLEELK